MPESQAAAEGVQTGLSVELGREAPLELDCGVSLGPFTLAYQTYGTLNAERSNAVLLCHALTGDHGKPGWWEVMVGPGKTFDTDRYFVICSNALGGCMGTSGPKEINPATGRPWGLDFPVITIRDMVKAQAMLLDHLGIEQLFCVSGGSMGGMQALQWVASYPERCYTAVPIACAASIRPRTSRSMRSAARRSWPIPNGARGAIRNSARIRWAASRWRAWPRTSPISRNRRCTGSLAARFRTGATSPTASMRIFRSRATFAIRDKVSSSVSTPTPTSTSPGRSTTSISRPTTTACWRMRFAGSRPASA
ncbi:Homoserine O-acetyltransferase [Geodia barretti]|uniref:Homoserine O-acetyltransferase n=1 Tax=Geodia barretti TaxID=519541 RepID=A0AA35TXQ4_GEOBA|nr:Homoserine O-acetyltransferase [Geodia barretti]